MVQWFWLGCFVFCLTATASAEEYVLHLEEVELTEQPGANEEPKETTVRHIEVLVKPNQPFRFKLQSGKETTTFSGTLKPSQDKNAKADFTIEVKYRYEFAIDNRTKHASGINTTLGLKVNEPINALELTVIKNQQPENPVKIDVRYVLGLKKVNPITAREVTTKHKV